MLRNQLRNVGACSSLATNMTGGEALLSNSSTWGPWTWPDTVRMLKDDCNRTEVFVGNGGVGVGVGGLVIF